MLTGIYLLTEEWFFSTDLEADAFMYFIILYSLTFDDESPISSLKFLIKVFLLDLLDTYKLSFSLIPRSYSLCSSVILYLLLDVFNIEANLNPNLSSMGGFEVYWLCFQSSDASSNFTRFYFGDNSCLSVYILAIVYFDIFLLVLFSLLCVLFGDIVYLKFLSILLLFYTAYFLLLLESILL